MTETREDLREQLLAILGAGRELTPDTDRQLADAFLRHLEIREIPPAPMHHAELHQPHYSLVAAGMICGATILGLLGAWASGPIDQNVFSHVLATVLIVAVVAAITRTLLYMARHSYHLPRIRVDLMPREDGTPRRG